MGGGRSQRGGLPLLGRDLGQGRDDGRAGREEGEDTGEVHFQGEFSLVVLDWGFRESFDGFQLVASRSGTSCK